MEALKQLAEEARAHGLVVLAGAGISMLPPSSLPGWNAFNSVILGALARRVGAYGGARFVVGQLQALIERRDKSTSFAPTSRPS
jgi:hypothetical protein